MDRVKANNKGWETPGIPGDWHQRGTSNPPRPRQGMENMVEFMERDWSDGREASQQEPWLPLEEVAKASSVVK